MNSKETVEKIFALKLFRIYDSHALKYLPETYEKKTKAKEARRLLNFNTHEKALELFKKGITQEFDQTNLIWIFYEPRRYQIRRAVHHKLKES